MSASDPADAWLARVVERHTSALSSPEFLKAVRALSARYVERRSILGRRSATDSAGKRAAFAGFFAPLHFLTTRAVVRAIGACDQPISQIVDLGCGTGVASAAWALEYPHVPALSGVDREGWALEEAAWNWRQLGLAGRTRRGDFVRAAETLVPSRAGTGVILAWSANELAGDARTRLLRALL
jgi:methylase of polypeptide subunit release factors